MILLFLLKEAVSLFPPITRNCDFLLLMEHGIKLPIQMWGDSWSQPFHAFAQKAEICFTWYFDKPVFKIFLFGLYTKIIFKESWWVLSLSWTIIHRFSPLFPVLQQSADLLVGYPVHAWKRLRSSAGVGDISSEFIAVQSHHNGFRLSL